MPARKMTGRESPGAVGLVVAVAAAGRLQQDGFELVVG